ncbi:MAG: zinc-ribbon domain-containing protein [Promethearchaeota archaeon]|jgi:DNA-directed RNA polymerase subunit RPC12/RpoP
MPTSNPTGFCPRCDQQVLLTRKDFDTCLAIVLLIFTGIGFFIYLGYYYSKKEDRCVHCGTQIEISKPQKLIQSSLYSTPGNISEELKGELPNFCAFCGEKLSAGLKFCPNCGSKVTEN